MPDNKLERYKKLEALEYLIEENLISSLIGRISVANMKHGEKRNLAILNNIHPVTQKRLTKKKLTQNQKAFLLGRTQDYMIDLAYLESQALYLQENKKSLVQTYKQLFKELSSERI